MKQIVCELCGSTDLVKQEGMYVCQFCNTKYTVEEARKLMVEGTVKIDRSDETQKLYIAARNARKASDYSTALKHYEKISAQDPNSWEALFYLTILKTDSVKNGELAAVAVSITTCLERVFQLLKENVFDEAEKKAAVKEIMEQCNETATLLIAGSQAFFHSMANIHGTTMVAGIGGMISSVSGATNAAIEHKNRCKIMASIMDVCGDSIESLFNMEDSDYTAYAVWCWKQVLEFNDAYKQVNKSYIDPGFIETCTTKIRKYEPDFGLIKTQNASGDVGDRILEIVFTASKTAGTPQELWISIDSSDTYKIWNGNNIRLQIEGDQHTIQTHTPLKKKSQYPINVPSSGLRVIFHSESTSYSVSQESLESNAETTFQSTSEIDISQEPSTATPVAPQPSASQNTHKNNAIIALILSFVGFIIPICSIIGLILAIIQVKKMDNSNKQLSKAALIVAIISTAITFVLPALVVMLFAIIVALG